jgi:hypothetical protein
MSIVPASDMEETEIFKAIAESENGIQKDLSAVKRLIVEKYKSKRCFDSAWNKTIKDGILQAMPSKRMWIEYNRLNMEGRKAKSTLSAEEVVAYKALQQQLKEEIATKGLPVTWKELLKNRYRNETTHFLARVYKKHFLPLFEEVKKKISFRFHYTHPFWNKYSLLNVILG